MTEHVRPLPTDPDELRTLALLAEAYLRLDSARLYGFITGGPRINVERCELAIAAARRAGVTYTEADVDRITTEVLRQHL